MRKPTICVPTRSDPNRAVQSQKMVRGLIFWIKKVEELYYPCSENKGADQISFAVTAKLVCAFVFAYANCRFSHAAAKIKQVCVSLRYSTASSQSVRNRALRFAANRKIAWRDKANLLY